MKYEGEVVPTTLGILSHHRLHSFRNPVKINAITHSARKRQKSSTLLQQTVRLGKDYVLLAACFVWFPLGPSLMFLHSRLPHSRRKLILQQSSADDDDGENEVQINFYSLLQQLSCQLGFVPG